METRFPSQSVNPAIAIVASLIIPGSGLILLGDKLQGFAFVAISILSTVVAFFFGIVGLALAGTFWLLNVVNTSIAASARSTPT